MTTAWTDRAAAYQAANRELLPKEYLLADLPAANERNVQYLAAQCGLLTERELGITETSNIQDLLDKLANGSYTAVEVTTAFIKRAVIAQQVVRFRIVPSTS
jgi:amidase